MREPNEQEKVLYEYTLDPAEGFEGTRGDECPERVLVSFEVHRDDLVLLGEQLQDYAWGHKSHPLVLFMSGLATHIRCLTDKKYGGFGINIPGVRVRENYYTRMLPGEQE